jgi:signal transduction histidine kinase
LLNLASPAEPVFNKHTLQEIMDESLQHASDRISLHKIDLEKKYPPEPLVVSVDKAQLIIAFTNILINAIEAMEINKGKLSVSIAASPDIYQVSIRDNGRGIPGEYLPKLFDPFFTLKKGGIGLGLTASYSIIQSHKARMQVESNVNEGTNFIINFKPN